jgi:hypothetical protein
MAKSLALCDQAAREMARSQRQKLVRLNVRFGSKADICSAPTHVRFTPNSDRKSRHAQMVMSALPLKADMMGQLFLTRINADGTSCACTAIA